MKVLDTTIGNEINSTIKNAIEESVRCGDACQFDFNGVTVLVDAESDPRLIHRDWLRGMSGYLGDNPTVGPHPAPELTEEDIASDNSVQEENDRKRKIQEEAYAKKQREKELVLEGALGNAGPIELSDSDGWKSFVDKNKDDYGSGVVRYAERWARLMQVRIDAGDSIADCAEDLSHLANSEGITGFMYGCAVATLSKCWTYGEELRRWHNKETQIGTEGDKANESGGVLNPALLTLGRSDKT